MLNRRHIRVKVMQSIYAMHQNGSDSIEKEEKFLLYSIDNILDLYLIMVSSLIEIGKKEVVLLKVIGGKHDYPGDINVHRYAWEFFKSVQ